MEYSICCADNEFILEDLVNKNLARGWQLYGNVVITGGGATPKSFYQCITNDKKVTKDKRVTKAKAK